MKRTRLGDTLKFAVVGLVTVIVGSVALYVWNRTEFLGPEIQVAATGLTLLLIVAAYYKIVTRSKGI